MKNADNRTCEGLTSTSELATIHIKSGGTVDTLIGRKIPLNNNRLLSIVLSPYILGTNMPPFTNKWDFEGRKVFDDLLALSRRENRCAEGGTRTHTEFPPLPPQDSVSTSSTTSAI